MLTTILTILKIIGIILLIIIGVILVLLLMVLFWPYNYKISGDNREKFNGVVVLSWFFHLLHIKAYYTDHFNIEARLLGIKFYDKQKKDAKKDSQKEPKKDSKKLSHKEDVKNTDKDSDVQESYVKDSEVKESEIKDEDLKESEHIDVDINNSDERDIDSLEEIYEIEDEDWTPEDDVKKKSPFAKLKAKRKSGNSNSKKNYNNNNNSTSSKSKDANKILNKFKAKKRISFSDWLWNIFDKIWDFIDDLPYKISDFIEKPEKKVNDFIDTIYYYDRILSSKGSQWVIDYVKRKVIKILKALKPSRCDINIDYASLDPEKATKAFEIYCMTIPYQPKHTNMNVAFDHDEFKFDARIKGSFILGTVLFHLATLIFNKKVKKFIKLMKREGK